MTELGAPHAQVEGKFLGGRRYRRGPTASRHRFCCFCWVFDAKPSSSSWKRKNFSDGGVGEVADAFGDEGVVDDVLEGGEEVG